MIDDGLVLLSELLNELTTCWRLDQMPPELSASSPTSTFRKRLIKDSVVHGIENVKGSVSYLCLSS